MLPGLLACALPLLAGTGTAHAAAGVARAELAATVPPPVELARLLDRVRTRLREAEGALFGRDEARAGVILGEVEATLAELRRDRGGELPPSNVAVFVLEERIAVLRRELTAARGAERGSPRAAPP